MNRMCSSASKDVCCHCNKRFTCRPAHPSVFSCRDRDDGKLRLTEIDKIVDFRHEDARNINSEQDVPEGQGEFKVKWRGKTTEEWIPGDDAFELDVGAVRKYFERIRAERKALTQKYMASISHVSSLNDIVCGGIVNETDTHYKLKVVGLSPDFLHELSHPNWGKKITPTFEVIREKGVLYVWVNQLQAEYIFRKTVHEFERKKRIRPTQKEIDNMDLFDFGRYLVRRDAGFYDDNNTSESEGGSVDVVN
ncbi:hypothetical protein PRIPAC_95708 [Pristionchus pacificus]|uniref:Uncharacterized protein n=1 Tax=Pristionchus pacificus TaxID=54126 RepID=A0A2A6BCZ4_PRIPA|nr:hypothetical protein PRIPAC_95708 [Pristionchus pacificus]|eukprot:PDM63716.1 hypothetical protein PRIPAC_49689 [Pristionchus pacificus]